ncbi:MULTISPECIES: AdeC/AdeK/OprM family multidrug efflux complex outer membrane factor [unclassified Acinetobacter]|uniref:AdeC/AdeK/OprM family multidrug efflux complex outer membrane factor n=1 Tax=unclassified Acinetobacter TaxID=196816 RepID=UPI002447D2AC|nr:MULTISPECIES: AdeC/AdeK/OprM family multidrug efflux complex outer membrane factor [unclassified Acinetobacter]MDH0030296.1 AdeC/AdeK/OprM family multidrug efflux complex outer membrane factor [Acinetobacter sp. GD04021]MDH0885864.1 AdeC/AdeK/OprM family multidrug efflux complex outer membrane factor [Acinetobacter sp. GD03873]MDH1082484.1 AdeC/AdeK/OprM family multidrug efflux complex outer membrane factor [Acinetobacter sp. GD03983]MDH2189124.1 AdeC/AdeK/OprM family multidrug efflux comple
MSKSAVLSRGFIVSTLSFYLTACISLQAPQPVIKSDIPQQFAQTHAGTSIAEQGYKTFFSDPRLLQVIEISLNHNRDLRTATLNIQRAQQQYRITQYDQLPTIGVTGNALRQVNPSTNPNNPYLTFQVGLGVTAYELDFWGRVQSLKDTALNHYLATQNAKQATQISLVSQVAQAWLNYSFATANLNLAEQTLKTQLDAYNLNKKRFDAGIDSEVPLHQSQISVETARNDVANYKTQVLQAQNLLDLLAGQAVPQSLLPDQTVKNISNERTFTTGLSSDLLHNRPDLKAAEYQLRAAGANIGVAKARMFPTISLIGSTGYASTELKDLFKSGGFSWSIGPSLDLPIFDWGTRKANIKISEIDQKIALSEYEKAIQSAFREVNDALAAHAYIEDRLAAQRRLVSATDTTYTLSTARFRAGIDSYLTVLDAQRSAYAAQQGLLILEQTKLNNQIELYKTLGGGL